MLESLPDILTSSHVDDNYEFLEKIGSGTFSHVYKAREKQSGNLVALKKIVAVTDAFKVPLRVNNEMDSLFILSYKPNDNVIRMLEVCRRHVGPNANFNNIELYFAFEFCDFTLGHLLRVHHGGGEHDFRFRCTTAEMKSAVQQLARGLRHIQRYKVIHRDVKPSNVLVTRGGVVKLADFGAATMTGYTHDGVVGSLWYRSPELLLYARNYGHEVDIWSLGCLVAELWTRTPLLRGSCEDTQLSTVRRLCGSLVDVESLTTANPGQHAWLRSVCEPYDTAPDGCPRRVRDELQTAIGDELALNLVDGMLAVCPMRRSTVHTILADQWFVEDPRPTPDLREAISRMDLIPNN